MATVNAGAVIPQSRVQPGMSEIEAGEQMAAYIENVASKAGTDADDIDIFDGGLVDPGPEARRKEAAPESSSPADEETESPDGDSSESTEDDDPAAASEDEDAVEKDAQEDDAQVQLEASQLAAVLGVDEDLLAVGDDGSVQLRYQVGDERGEATLKDVLASYQLQSHVNRKSEQLSEERRQLHEAVLQREHELQAAVQQATGFQKVMEDRVVEQYSRVDWDALEREDPGRAAALQLKMSNEVQAIRAEADNVRQAAMQAHQQAQQQQQYAQQQRMMEEQARLFEHLPDLKDEAKRPEILTGYQNYLTGYGFTPQEIQNIPDHRWMRVINDAFAHTQGKTQGKVQPADKALIQKRLVKVPKVARAGTPRDPGELKGDRRQRSANRLRKTGSDADAARFAVDSGIVDSLL